ncbi:MAG TPA: RNA polymerase sigma factor [Candidatus Acidoferrales bacterium]|nr:RNA polymerase sigma factor [Candidatus Acidoferrales bacterium]
MGATAATLSLPAVAALEPASRAAGDDAALVERARAGDADAFRVLVERHRDRAVGLALRITRSRADAEDAAQDAFVRAWRALPAFRGESAFGTWLHRIVARRALDRAGSARVRRGREDELPDADDLPAAEPAIPGDPLLARRLNTLMGELSAPQRAALTLYYLEDRAVEHVATALGMPENTVKTHLSRARAALREAWVREGGERP